MEDETTGPSAKQKNSGEIEKEEGSPKSRYNLRKRKPINYDDTKRYKAKILYQNGLLLEDNRKILEEMLKNGKVEVVYLLNTKQLEILLVL